jgi:hypothetical protein
MDTTLSIHLFKNIIIYEYILIKMWGSRRYIWYVSATLLGIKREWYAFNKVGVYVYTTIRYLV